MTQYEIYVFFLCLTVFVLLVSLFSFLLSILIKQEFKLIKNGIEDERLKKEYTDSQKRNKKLNICGCFLTLVICIVFIGFFAFSLFVNIRQDSYFENIPTIKVVNTDSMSRKHEKNTYLKSNNLNNQIQTFDLVKVYKAPAEKDIELYDIVVYEVNDTQIIHRIVGIEEPRSEHPNERYFLCQGDAVESPDRFPVYYSQIKAIYKGERIPFIGSFVKFMQSPAGWLCAVLIVFGVIGMPILERKMEKVITERLSIIGFISSSGEILTSEETKKEEEDEALV